MGLLDWWNEWRRKKTGNNGNRPKETFEEKNIKEPKKSLNTYGKRLQELGEEIDQIQKPKQPGKK